MTNDLSYETIWQVTQKEKQTNELQLLPRTIYDDIGTFLRSFDGRELNDDEINVKKNTLRLINELYERRKQKILIYVAYKKQLPQPAVQREVDLYNKMLDLAEGNKLETERNSNVKVLKALQALPSIILPSGKKIGPFEKGQVVEIDNNEEDIKFLLNNTICQRV